MLLSKEKIMDISGKNWEQIRKFWGGESRVTPSILPYCVFATTDEDGSPRMAPYSSLMLGENRQGFYFDHFSGHLSQNLERDQRIWVLLLKSKKRFWMKTLLFGRFDHAPAIRLMGTVGKKREATMQEVNAFQKPLKKMKLLKGYQPFWGIYKQGREINFESFETVNCGPIKYKESI
jgi:hypothetical protein